MKLYDIKFGSFLCYDVKKGNISCSKPLGM